MIARAAAAAGARRDAPWAAAAVCSALSPTRNRYTEGFVRGRLAVYYSAHNRSDCTMVFKTNPDYLNRPV